MTLWQRLNGGKPAPTPSDAGRALGAARIEQDRARRTATTDRLRNCIAAGRIAHLGWKA